MVNMQGMVVHLVEKIIQRLLVRLLILQDMLPKTSLQQDWPINVRFN